MLLTAIWNVLSKFEPYSAKGYLADKLTEHSVVISKSEGLALLRKRVYIFWDELTNSTSQSAQCSIFFQLPFGRLGFVCPFGTFDTQWLFSNFTFLCNSHSLKELLKFKLNIYKRCKIKIISTIDVITESVFMKPFILFW